MLLWHYWFFLISHHDPLFPLFLFSWQHSASTASFTSVGSILQRSSPELTTMTWACWSLLITSWRNTSQTWSRKSKVNDCERQTVVQDRVLSPMIYAVHVSNLFVLWHSEWLNACTVKKLVLVVTCLETNEVMERWQFDIECDKTAKECRSESPPSTATFIPPPNNIWHLGASWLAGISSEFQQVATVNHLQELHLQFEFQGCFLWWPQWLNTIQLPSVGWWQQAGLEITQIHKQS